MRKMLVLVLLVVLVSVGLTAARPIPPPIQTINGPLRWQRASVCGVSDYVPQTAMNNVYLTGKFAPTRGLLQGCSIAATGFYYKASACTYFSVSSYSVTCVTTSSVASER